jgi:hypothetical protein
LYALHTQHIRQMQVYRHKKTAWWWRVDAALIDSEVPEFCWVAASATTVLA